jgi:hypothetical protein
VGIQVVPGLQCNLIGLFCLLRDFWSNMDKVDAETKFRGKGILLNTSKERISDNKFLAALTTL